MIGEQSINDLDDFRLSFNIAEPGRWRKTPISLTTSASNDRPGTLQLSIVFVFFYWLLFLSVAAFSLSFLHPNHAIWSFPLNFDTRTNLSYWVKVSGATLTTRRRPLSLKVSQRLDALKAIEWRHYSKEMRHSLTHRSQELSLHPNCVDTSWNLIAQFTVGIDPRDLNR